MSPEQLLAHRVELDHRSDIYSLGVSLYEAVTLDLPFSADSGEAYISAVSTKEPLPARKRHRAVPRDLETILMKCLERDPDKRYASAAELGSDLDCFLRDVPVAARRTGALTRHFRFVKRHWMAFGNITIAAILIFIALWFLFQQQANRRYEQMLIELEKGSLPARDKALLRETFMDGRLPDHLSRKLARSVLKPSIRVSRKVEPASLTKTSAMFELVNYEWNFHSVVEATVLLDGVPIRQEAALPHEFLPMTLVEGEKLPKMLVASENLEDLPTGEHRLMVEFSAWIFDMPDGENLYTISETMSGSDRHVEFGLFNKRWEDFWPELRAETGSIHVEGLWMQKKFRVVDTLENFPAPEHAAEFEKEMESAIQVEDFQFWREGNMFLYRLRVPRRLPVTFAGIMEIETPQGRGTVAGDIVIYQGELYDSHEGQDVEWEALSSKDSCEPYSHGIELGEHEVPVRVRLVGKQAVARKHQGINRFWDGTLEFEGIAKISG
jgi:hypothetical protein